MVSMSVMTATRYSATKDLAIIAGIRVAFARVSPKKQSGKTSGCSNGQTYRPQQIKVS